MKEQDNIMPKYIGRAAELEVFQLAIERITQLGSVFQSAQHWWGSRGIGKSTLLEMMGDRCASQGIPWVLIGSHKEDGQNWTISTLAEGVVSGLIASVGTDDKSWEKCWQTHKESVATSSVNSIGRAMQGFVNDMHIAYDSPLVLMFDDARRMDPDVKEWLEGWFVLPVVRGQKNLVITTGASDYLPWKKFEVKRRVVDYELQGLSQSELNSWLVDNAPGSMGWQGEIMALTDGYPAGLLGLIDYLSRVGISDLDNEDSWFPGALELLQMHVTSAYEWEKLQPDLQSGVEVMSLMRQFDFPMFRKLLSEIEPTRFGKYNRNEMATLKLMLSKAGILKSRNMLPRFEQIDHHLRRHLQIQSLEQLPDLSNRVDEIAVGIWRDYQIRARENGWWYVKEELFHRLRLGDQLDLEEFLMSRMEEYSKPGQNRLLDALIQDGDLADMVGWDEYQSLIKGLRQKR